MKAEKAQEVKVQNAIRMKIAYYVASIPCDTLSAQQNTIDELWKAIRESELTKDSVEVAEHGRTCRLFCNRQAGNSIGVGTS